MSHDVPIWETLDPSNNLDDIRVSRDCELGESTIVSHEAWRGSEICFAIVIEPIAEEINLLLLVFVGCVVLVFSVADGGDEPQGDLLEELGVEVGVSVEETLSRIGGYGQLRCVDAGGGERVAIDVCDLEGHTLVFIVAFAEPLLAVEPVFEGVDVGWMCALLRFELVEPMTGVRPGVE